MADPVDPVDVPLWRIWIKASTDVVCAAPTREQAVELIKERLKNGQLAQELITRNGGVKVSVVTEVLYLMEVPSGYRNALPWREDHDEHTVEEILREQEARRKQREK